MDCALGFGESKYGEKNCNNVSTVISSSSLSETDTYDLIRSLLKPLLLAPGHVLQHQECPIGRDQHVQAAASDDHVAGVLNNPTQHIGLCRHHAVRVARHERTVGLVEENACSCALRPSIVARRNVKSGADGRLVKPRGLWRIGGGGGINTFSWERAEDILSAFWLVGILEQAWINGLTRATGTDQ